MYLTQCQKSLNSRTKNVFIIKLTPILLFSGERNRDVYNIMVQKVPNKHFKRWVQNFFVIRLYGSTKQNV